jgi:hypothetical protein
MEDNFDTDSECACSIFPGEIRADEDHMAKYDIDRWLETGDTHHFTVPAIVTVQR